MLVIVSGYMNNTEVAVDALSIWFVYFYCIFSSTKCYFVLDFANSDVLSSPVLQSSGGNP